MLENIDILSQANAISKPTITINPDLLLIHKDYSTTENPLGYKTVAPTRTILKQIIKNKNDFVAFVKEYKTDGTKLFFNDSVVTARFNYSQKDIPDFSDSFAQLQLETTSQYKTFSDFARGKKLSQKEFVKILKELEKAIVSHEAIEIVSLAQNLQSVQKVNSMMTNSSRTTILDAQVRGGANESITLPERIEFSLPIYKNDLERLTQFEVEVFADFDGQFGINLVCYRIDEIVEETTRDMLDEIRGSLDGISAFQV